MSLRLIKFRFVAGVKLSNLSWRNGWNNNIFCQCFMSWDLLGSIYCCYMSYQSWRVKISNPITLYCNEPNEGGFKWTKKIYAINFLPKQINISSLKPERFHTNLKVKLFLLWVWNQLFVTIWYLIKLFSSGDFNFLVVKSCE